MNEKALGELKVGEKCCVLHFIVLSCSTVYLDVYYYTLLYNIVLLYYTCTVSFSTKYYTVFEHTDCTARTYLPIGLTCPQ